MKNRISHSSARRVACRRTRCSPGMNHTGVPGKGLATGRSRYGKRSPTRAAVTVSPRIPRSHVAPAAPRQAATIFEERLPRFVAMDAAAPRAEVLETPPDAGAHDAFALYLNEIGQIPLLTPLEEIRLAKRVRKGDEQARQEMIRANLRLVVKIAREYQNYGVPLLDLINEGNIGLVKAVERFNPRKGAKLSTYAAFWIKQCIRRALTQQARTIRLPNHLTNDLFNLRKVTVELEQKLGRPPTTFELATRMKITPARISQWQRVSQSISSLDAFLGDAEDSEALASIVEDVRAESPYAALERKMSEATLQELVKQLPEREAIILGLRFGLNDQEVETLERIGAKFGVTRERIRQLETIALKKLRRMLLKLETVSRP